MLLCFKAKPEHGIRQVSSLTTLQRSDRRCGNQKASPCWGLQSAAVSTLQRRWTKGSRRRGDCGTQFLRSPDLQCAWQILLQSANPRANHSMRTLPTVSAAYCDAHDAGIWAIARALLGGIHQEDEEARQRATLPMRMGGLGLRSAARCAPAAFWASWADSLEMIRDRTPEVAELVEHRLTAEDPQNGC